jgi:hypothetical protein
MAAFTIEGYAACIGGGSDGNSGIINVTGGAVIAKGGSIASIGRGGTNATTSSGSITISGGTVYATSHGIGVSGQNGTNASTMTTITQNAVVFANTINPNATIVAVWHFFYAIVDGNIL